MCIACEMGFWIALDEPPPGAKLSPEERARFSCDTPEDSTPQPAQPIVDERKP